MHAKADVPKTGYYLYGFGAANGFNDFPVCEGVLDAPVEVAEVGAIAVLLSPVPLDQFNERTLASQLDDLTWLEKTTRTHERVLQEALGRAGTVVPARFCTVYESKSALTDSMQAHEKELLTVLRRLNGKVEWGVRVLCQNTMVRARLKATNDRFEQLREAAPDSQGEGEGRSYLNAKKLERALDDAVERVKASEAARCHRRLTDASEDQALHVASRGGEQRDSETLLNGSYLLQAESASDFHDLIGTINGEFASTGMSLEVTGPWPPYSFTRLNLS